MNTETLIRPPVQQKPSRKKRKGEKILFVTPECAPWIKTGGLGDVSASLAIALAASGHEVQVLMPAYQDLAQTMAHHTQPASEIKLDATASWPEARLLSWPQASGFTLLLLDCPELFAQTGSPYVDEGGRDHPHNARRFAFMSHVAALLGTAQSPLPQWRPDVIHCHDWTCGLTPMYLAEAKARGEQGVAASLITIHNLAFQGIFSMAQADELGIAQRWRSVEGVEFWGQISMLKAALQCADAITTVSPTYAKDIQTQAHGFGLDGVLRAQSAKLQGILNGIDTRLWDPASDPHLAQNYTVKKLSGKAVCKEALQQRCGLPVEKEALLFGLISRLTSQKGIDLVIEALPWMRANHCQLVLLGRGDQHLEQALRTAAAQHPECFSVTLGFDEPLAHQIEAGADCFLMPSRYEPCGLSQMYSQRYGTPPLVHATGGLVDSVTDIDEADGGGFLIGQSTVDALLEGLARVRAAHARPVIWKRLQQRGMQREFGWAQSAQQYSALYTEIANANANLGIDNQR
jgi:starch synthase